MAHFHPLVVTNVEKTIRDAVVVTLDPGSAETTFDFVPGQYLTLRHDFDGTEVRRNYSICTSPDEGRLQVGIKRVDGGAFSTWANTELKIGDVIDAMPPAGRFFTVTEPENAKNYVGFAGGSGITPVLSIMKTVLATEPGATFTLVYANRAVNTIMFREEIEDLKNVYLGRLSVIHVLEEDAQDIELFSGRVDEAKCAALFRTWIDVANTDTAFLCGPEPMMLGIAKALQDHGMPKDQIRFELFSAAQPGRLAQQAMAQAKAAGKGKTVSVELSLDGATQKFQMPAGVPLLDAAREHGIDVPFACKAGVCSTCRAKVLEGEVEMIANHALEDYEVEQGYVLTCQCLPLSDHIVVDYDG